MAANAPKIQGLNLVGLRGRYARQIFALPAGGASVGRESDNDLVLSGSSLSRRHAQIEGGAGGYFLVDAGSANGTWINGTRAEGRTPIQHKDRVRFADEEFVFVDGDRGDFDTRGYRLAEQETVVIGKLLFDRGAGPEELLLEEPTVTLGREDTNDVVVDLAGVSGNHCKIRSVDETFTLVDLKSTNGTYLEGSEKRVDEVVLRPGSVFLVGACRFTFQTETVTRAKASYPGLPAHLTAPGMVDILLPVIAAFLVVLTIVFAVMIVVKGRGDGPAPAELTDIAAPAGLATGAPEAPPSEAPPSEAPPPGAPPSEARPSGAPPTPPGSDSPPPPAEGGP